MVALRAQAPAHGETVEVRHHHVEQEQVGLMLLDGSERGVAVVHRADVVALQFEGAHHRFTDRPVVFGYQHASSHGRRV